MEKTVAIFVLVFANIVSAYNIDNTRPIEIQVDEVSNALFGHSVAFSNEALFIGAPKDRHSFQKTLRNGQKVVWENKLGNVYKCDVNGRNCNKIVGM